MYEVSSWYRVVCVGPCIGVLELNKGDTSGGRRSRMAGCSGIKMSQAGAKTLDHRCLTAAFGADDNLLEYRW